MFPFSPKAWGFFGYISGESYTNISKVEPFQEVDSNGTSDFGSVIICTAAENTVEWYHTKSAMYQFNQHGLIWLWFAIG